MRFLLAPQLAVAELPALPGRPACRPPPGSQCRPTRPKASCSERRSRAPARSEDSCGATGRSGYRAFIAVQPTDPSGAASASSREGRLAKNEIFFREANELIERDAATLDGNVDFICECSSAGCIERLMLTRREYEHVRAEGKRFVVVVGHEQTSVEHVVERHTTYLVVEKHGRAGIDADRADPRDPG
jgi:hypothetical protein